MIFKIKKLPRWSSLLEMDLVFNYFLMKRFTTLWPLAVTSNK